MDAELKQLHDAISDSVQGMSVEELTRHPEGKWSTAEILEHLYRTYRGTVKGFELCLKAGKPMASKPTLKQRIAAAAVTRFGYFPEGRQAPERTIPKGMPPETVISELKSQLAEMDAAINQAEAKYGRRTLVLDHPVLGPLNTQQWRRFHNRHGQHHVKQIRGLRGLH